MAKQNVLIFDEQGYFYGSTQKLERQIANMLSKDFNVYFAGGPITNQATAEDLKANGVFVVPFEFRAKQTREPFNLKKMNPDIMDLIKKYNIHCIYTPVFAHYQFPLNTVPASIPFVLISPFGHYTTNGNVYKTYVSGKENRSRILNRGVTNVDCFFNPLTDYSSDILNKPPVGEVLVFGRIGRGEDSIFDPIAVRAFKKLEDEYGNHVKYIVVNAPPAWRQMVRELGVKNMEFRGPITDFESLSKFYGEIDVFAHARKDGETVGIAIGEAMLAGNPIVTHRSHYHNDHFYILDSSFAKWCEVDNVEQYFENLMWMVEHKDQIRSMGGLARKRALEIFSKESQTPKIIETFQLACQYYYHDTFKGKLKGYLKLYWENFKSVPFLTGKILTYYFPSAYKFLRKLYYE